MMLRLGLRTSVLVKMAGVFVSLAGLMLSGAYIDWKRLDKAFRNGKKIKKKKKKKKKNKK